MVTSSTSINRHSDRPVAGIATFVANLALMALLGAAVRELVDRDYPLGEVLLFRYVFASACFWVILLATSNVGVLSTQRPLDHAIRSFSGVISLALFYFAITRIPIADATAIAYAAPIIIALFAIFLLGETIGPRRWAAIVIGFAGVLRDFGLPPDALGLALASFNIGVEIGQVAIVAVAVPVLLGIDRLMKVATRSRALVTGLSLLIGGMGLYWLAARTVLAYGGTSSGDQKRALAAGCDIIVGTPGRLLDFVTSAWLMAAPSMA